MKYELKVIVLENCPYSIAAVELLNNYKIKFQKIEVNHNNKEQFKTSEINTFPQIYILNNNKQLLLGGYSDLENITNIINSTKNLDKIKQTLKKNYLNNKNINNKYILRIIQMFINLK